MHRCHGPIYRLTKLTLIFLFLRSPMFRRLKTLNLLNTFWLRFGYRLVFRLNNRELDLLKNKLVCLLQCFFVTQKSCLVWSFSLKSYFIRNFISCPQATSWMSTCYCHGPTDRPKRNKRERHWPINWTVTIAHVIFALLSSHGMSPAGI